MDEGDFKKNVDSIATDGTLISNYVAVINIT